jgi:hypothetical protein
MDADLRNGSARQPASAPGKTILLVVDESRLSRMRAPLRFACRRACATGSRLALVGVYEPPRGEYAWLSAAQAIRGAAKSDFGTALAQLAENAAGCTGMDPVVLLREGDPAEEVCALIDADPDICNVIVGLDIRSAAMGGSPPSATALLNNHCNRLRVPVTVVPRHMTDSEVDMIS